MKTQPDGSVVACTCRRRPFVVAWEGYGEGYRVECCWFCWHGPRRFTKVGAVTAWNAVMAAATAAKARARNLRRVKRNSP